MIKIKAYLASLLLLFLSCEAQKNNQYTIPPKEKITCIPYFDFDKIEYYSIKIDEPDIWTIYNKKEKTKDEKRFIQLILEYTPAKIEDTTIINGIEKSGYIKRDIAMTKFDSINDIFCERKHDNAIYSGCAAFYRDILVFKKQGKIIGVAKICFTCNQNIITGTKLNTSEFGQSGDYRKLKKLLDSM